MAAKTRHVTVGTASAQAVILASATTTFPLTVSAAGGANILHVAVGGYAYTVAAATYTTITSLVTAVAAATPTAGSPALATVFTVGHTGTKLKLTVNPTGASGNGQHVTGTFATNTHLAGVNATGGVTGPALLWRTSVGYTGAPAITPGAGTFYPGTANDPLPIIVENVGTNPIYIGTSAVTSSTGTRITKGQSLSFSSVGGDSLYARATGGTSAVAVTVLRQ